MTSALVAADCPACATGQSGALAGAAGATVPGPANVPLTDSPVVITGQSDGASDSPVNAPDSPMDTGGRSRIDPGGSGYPAKKPLSIPHMGWVWEGPDLADSVGEAVEAAVS